MAYFFSHKRAHLYLIALIAFVLVLTLYEYKSQTRVDLGDYDGSYPRNIASDIKESESGSCSDDGAHAACFLGKQFCHPGYFGEECTSKKTPANPWYTEDCPNLAQDITFSFDMPLGMLSRGKNCMQEQMFGGLSKCAYLCFSHPLSGVAQIPLSYWKKTMDNEVGAWKYAEGVDDRGVQHKQAFNSYADVPQRLGNYIEIGAGPYTQTQFIRDKLFDRITFLDPAASEYQKYTKNCQYKNGTFFGRRVKIINGAAENLHMDPSFGKYDSLMSINVIEHVHDAYRVLSNVYKTLKRNGLIIYHDRYFRTPPSGDGILGGGNRFHPIRLTKSVFDHFLSKFEKIFLNIIEDDSNYGSIYFIGRKI